MKKVEQAIWGGLRFQGALQTATDLAMVLHSEGLTCEFTEFMRTNDRAIEGGPGEELYHMDLHGCWGAMVLQKGSASSCSHLLFGLVALESLARKLKETQT